MSKEMSDTLLNIISKFPTKESRLHLRFILRDSSKDLQWRKEISPIFYLLHKLDCDDQNEPISSEYVQLHEVLQQDDEVPEILPEVSLLPEKSSEVVLLQEVMPKFKELTDMEKIQLEYEQKILNILQNK